jgi:GNAT superfamily N-acetyltransferase
MNGRVAIRLARGDDAAATAAVHWASRRLSYRDILPEENLEGRTPEVLTAEWVELLARRDGTEHLVAVDRDKIVGFVSGRPVRERRGPVTGDLSGVAAEISLLYVVPERMGQGIGRALFGRMAQRLAGLGHRALLVWGYRDNRFLDFYLRLGGVPGAESDREMDGRLLPLRCFVWRDLGRLVAACAEDRQRASLRASPGFGRRP